MIEILGEQITRTMRLLGVTSLAELTPAHVTQLERLAPRALSVPAATAPRPPARTASAKPPVNLSVKPSVKPKTSPPKAGPRKSPIAG